MLTVFRLVGVGLQVWVLGGLFLIASFCWTLEGIPKWYRYCWTP